MFNYEWLLTWGVNAVCPVKIVELPVVGLSGADCISLSFNRKTLLGDNPDSENLFFGKCVHFNGNAHIFKKTRKMQ